GPARPRPAPARPPARQAAPAGSGKTVLLGECARRAPPGVQVVWLALGGVALDPATFRRRHSCASSLS
ncbi:hypothetical protein ACV341_33115, partial [Pseudomonas aeruginosa]